MRRLAVALALLVATALPACAQQTAPPSRFVAVWGRGEAHAKPDMAALSAGVVTEGRTAEVALAANSAAVTKIIAAVKGLGVASRDLQTAGVSLTPIYRRPNGTGAPSRIAGYRASNRLRIRLHALDKLGRLLDAVVAAGANMAGGLSFGVADPGRLADQARDAAMADARRKAELLAKAAGAMLGPVISISEEGAGRSPAPLRATTFGAPAAAPVPIERGATTVSAALRVVYAIE